MLVRKFLGVAACSMLFGMAACSGDENKLSPVEAASNDAEGTPVSSNVMVPESSSSIIKSSGGVVESSSSVIESSDGVVESSSSVAESSGGIAGPCTTPESVSDMWYGPTAFAYSIYNVNTGLDNGSETSGYWFSFENEDGDAGVVWPDGPTDYDISMDPVIVFCKGICGTFKFTNEGVTGIGFNVAGIVSWAHEVPDFADASAWGGLCVTYASESDLVVAMSIDTTYAYVNNLESMPKVTLPKSLEVNTICSKWDDFVTPAGTAGNPAHLASMIFAARGEANTRSKFNIVGVGKYADAKNVCEQSAEPFVSAQE